jgi:hypothetical protein
MWAQEFPSLFLGADLVIPESHVALDALAVCVSLAPISIPNAIAVPRDSPSARCPLQPTTIQERLAGEIPRAKAELAKHCTEITLTPEGDSYKLSGEWDLLGSVRSDGAGGQNRTGYARLFRAALYQ